MGSRGPLAKSEDRAQGHRERRLQVIDGSGTTERPKAPSGLLRATRDEWDAYWGSPVAEAAGEACRPVVERLFVYRDEWRRAVREFRRGERLVQGSKGQPRISPLADYIGRLEADMSRLEASIGLTPLAQARLGLTVGQAQMTVAELNRALADADSDDEDPRAVIAAEADPRSAGL